MYILCIQGGGVIEPCPAVVVASETERVGRVHDRVRRTIYRFCVETTVGAVCARARAGVRRRGQKICANLYRVRVYSVYNLSRYMRIL